MSLFDRYIAVDWSANNGPKTGRDSIWIGEATATDLAPSRNPSTRAAAMADITSRLERAAASGERVLIGFDFPFGYPAGAAAALCGGTGWTRLWSAIGERIDDSSANISNRFAVASGFNAVLGEGGPRFWGCPKSLATAHLSTRKAGAVFDRIAEFRAVEHVAKGAKSTWQLFYNGSVGSQCLLGIASLQRLRHHPGLGSRIAVWPFDTDFDRDLDAPILIAEIYPSLRAYDRSVVPKDRAQVEAQVSYFAALDNIGGLRRALSLPADHVERRRVMVDEEGWIVGAGHGDLAR